MTENDSQHVKTPENVYSGARSDDKSDETYSVRSSNHEDEEQTSQISIHKSLSEEEETGPQEELIIEPSSGELKINNKLGDHDLLDTSETKPHREDEGKTRKV